MSLTSYRAAPPRVISAFGFSRMSDPCKSRRDLSHLSILRSQNVGFGLLFERQGSLFVSVIPLLLPKQKGRLRAARVSAEPEIEEKSLC